MQTSLVLVMFASRSKEDSDVDPLEDELELSRSMREAGFRTQVQWTMPLSVPAEEPLGSIMAAADLGHIIRHIMIKMTKDKRSVQSLEWTQKRVGAYLCNKWLKHELKLLSTTGQVVPPIESEVTVPLLDQIYSLFFLFFFSMSFGHFLLTSGF